MATAVSAGLNTATRAAKNSTFRLLFCHGLGSAKHDIIASKIQQWANQQRILFHDLNYRNYGLDSCVWNINDWEEDILQELKYKILTTTDSQNIPLNTVIVCYSAASQALLRALLHKNSSSNNNNNNANSKTECSQPAGILMISPGVGMNVKSYIERLMPGSFQHLKAGKILDHPSGDPSIKIKISLECLENFVNNCPSKKSLNAFPIKCPVRIVHGLNDKLVPYRNSVDLLDRLETNDKNLYLTNDGHFVRDQQIINYALDNLWSSMEKNSALNTN